MKPIVIHRLEVYVIVLFLVGLGAGVFYLHLPFSTFCLLYLFGIFFEILTNQEWIYNPILDDSTFMLRDRNVDLIFGLGWIGTLSIGASIGQWLAGFDQMPLWLSWFIGVGIVGIICEKLFLTLKLWTYNWDCKSINMGLNPAPQFAGLPLSVILGYFLFDGPMVYLLVKIIAPYLH